MSRTRGLLAAVGAYGAWGLLGPVGKLLLQDTGPLTLNAVRTAGTLVLFSLAWGPRELGTAIRLLRGNLRLWILGVVGLAGTFLTYLGSLLYLDATIAVVLVYISPLIITVIAHRRLGERVTNWAIPAAIASLVGSLLVVLEPTQGRRIQGGETFGIVLGLLSVAFWCFYTLYLKELSPSYSDRQLTLTSFLSSGLVFFALAIPIEHLRFHVSAASLGRFGVYVLFPSFVSFQLYAIAVRKLGATITSILLGIELVATAVFSFFLNGEQFSIDKLVGIAIVLCAISGFLIFEARRTAAVKAS